MHASGSAFGGVSPKMASFVHAPPKHCEFGFEWRKPGAQQKQQGAQQM